MTIGKWFSYLPYIVASFFVFWVSTWILFRLIFRWISTKVRKKMALTLSVSKIHFTYLEGLTIEKEGFFKCQIEHIGINSSLINSSCNKLFTLLVGPSSVNLIKCSPEEKKCTSKESNSVKDTTFLNTLAASSIRVFFQHCGIVFQNLELNWVLNDVISAWSADIKIGLDLKTKIQRVGVVADFMNCKLTALKNDFPLLFIRHSFHINSSLIPGKPVSEMSHNLKVLSLELDMSEELLSWFLRFKKSKSKKTPEAEIEVQSPDVADLPNLGAVLKKVPKNIRIILENIKLVYRLDDQREFQMDWNCVLSWQRFEDNSCEALIDILGFVINGRNHCKLLLFKQITTKIHINPGDISNQVKIDSNVDSFHVDFIYEEVVFWKGHFLAVRDSYFQSCQVASSPTSSSSSSSSSRISTKDIILQQCIFDIDIKLQNCSCDLYYSLDNALASSLVIFYLGQLSVSLKDGNFMTKVFNYASSLTDLYCYLNIADILPETTCTLPCQLEDDEPACLPSSERHAWGRLIECGKIEVNGGLSNDLFSCETQITYIAMEWSLALGESLLSIINHLGINLMLRKKDKKLPTTNTEKSMLKVDLDVSAENLNIFLVGDKEGGYDSFLQKIDNFTLSGGNQEKLDVIINGMVFTQLKELQKLKTGDTFYCYKSDTFSDNLFSLSLITSSFTNNKEMDIKAKLSPFVIDWTPNIHMAFYEQITDIQTFTKSFQQLFPSSPSSSSSSSSPSSSSPLSDESTKSINFPSINIQLESFKLKVATAETHSLPILCLYVTFHRKKLLHKTLTSKISFLVDANDIIIDLSASKKGITCPELSMWFDVKEIFRFEDIQLQDLSPQELHEERIHFKDIHQENRAWGIACHSTYINFPYDFKFAESLEKLQNVIKMLKLLHKKPKSKDYVEQLQPDLLLSFQNITIELEDDPFEVQLNDNYLLLTDEIDQAIEREQKLEAKLNQIKTEKGTMLSGKKLDELRKNLKEKNAQIYIDRSKEMYEERSQRKELFLVVIKGVQLAVLADQTLHGEENIRSHMNNLDKDCDIPDDIQFSTLWCRMVHGKFDFMRMLLRDFPQPFLSIETFTTRGMVIGSEACGVETATREVQMKIGTPWEDLTLKKNMPPLKFYYDLKWDMSSCQVAWGANFEPTFSMVTQAFDLLSKKSVDPSPPLPFWDKIRLLFHGSLKVDIPDFNILLSASRDPYNVTEMLEIEWTTVTLEWTNGFICIDGDFDLYTRTASKYDDSKVVHFPAFQMSFQLEWLCEGDPNDHHNIYPTSPKYISSKNFDSYALFRSSNLNMNVNMLTCNEQTKKEIELDPPVVFLYASTFRWFQNYQATVINRVSRPIKRGSLFRNPKAKKVTLGRHYKLVGIDWIFPSLNVTYWGSFQQEVGFETAIQSGSLSVAYQVFISPHPDSSRLLRRPIANWIIRGLQSILKDVRVSMLQSIEKKLDAEVTDDELLTIEDDDVMDVLKHYLFSVKKVEYKRQSAILEDAFTHKVLLHGFKGAWTAINRELVVGLFEAYTKMQKLKTVLSSEALKITGETVDTTKQREKAGNTSILDTSTKSPLTRMQSGHGALLLEQLVSEQSSKFIAQSEESETIEQDLNASLDVGDEDDIIQRNWHIELINSQVLLHGTESKGALIVTAGNATIFKRLHKPLCAATDVLTKLNKVTWCGKFRNLQYFSTVTNFKDLTVENIPWLTNKIISGDEIKENDDPHNLSSFTRTSDAVGAFVDVSVNKATYQLQRVIARCECDFRYVSLDDELDPVAEEFVPSVPETTEAIENTVSLASTLNLKHGRVEMSTSSSQYTVIADICQNLIFYTEPKRKEEQEKLEKMKFKLQLTAGQDLKGGVSQLQTRVRRTLLLLRRYEHQLFDYKRQEEEVKVNEGNPDIIVELGEILSDLQEQIEVTKEQLFEDVEELKILISAYKDVQRIQFTPSPQKGVSFIRKKIDVQLDDLQWLVTQQDGQLGIANVFIRKFKYNQLTYKDDRTEHCFEIGHFALKNLLPNENYREALIPHEIGIRRHLDKSVMLRVFCRLSAPVAGISVKEHFEVNVCPIAVRLTHKLFVNMESFLFPKSQGVEKAEHFIEFQPGVHAPTLSKEEPKVVTEVKEVKNEQKENKQTKFEEDTDEKSEETQQVEDKTKDDTKFKIPPPRPPPPRNLPQRPPLPRKLSARRKASEDETDLPGLKKKSSSGLLEVQPNSPPAVTTPKSAGYKKTSFRETFSSADRDVNTMKERAAKNQTFIYVKIPEVPVCFSYKGEKERNIEDAHDFNLCLPTLEYHSHTWTWQDLFEAMKKDYIQTLVPQILKEKLHLKSAADTKPAIAQVEKTERHKTLTLKTSDSNKAKLLFGEKSGQKKSAKKALFGKLLKSSKNSSHEKLNEATSSTGSSSSLESEEMKKELMGKGVEPSNLQQTFNQLRDMKDNKK